MTEYRVIWQRAGQAKKRKLYQTQKGAENCVKVQTTASEEMEWLSTPLPAIVFGPVIESREVSSWA